MNNDLMIYMGQRYIEVALYYASTPPISVFLGSALVSVVISLVHWDPLLFASHDS